MSTATLEKAKRNKADELYTQLPDIEAELRHYWAQFRGKVVFCNCDDPFESNFFKYFALNFNFLGLKKLIATCYGGSPVMGEQLSLFDIEPLEFVVEEAKPAYKRDHRGERRKRGWGGGLGRRGVPAKKQEEHPHTAGGRRGLPQ